MHGYSAYYFEEAELSCDTQKLELVLQVRDQIVENEFPQIEKYGLQSRGLEQLTAFSNPGRNYVPRTQVAT